MAIPPPEWTDTYEGRIFHHAVVSYPLRRNDRVRQGFRTGYRGSAPTMDIVKTLGGF